MRHRGGERFSFRGQIAGIGSTSGVRIVLGRWRETPMGSFEDAMVALPDGHRVLLAPRDEVAEFIASTYTFDEIRVEPFEVVVDGDRWRVRSRSLRLDFVVGRRTWIGALLRIVPQAVAEAPWWSSLIDPVARILMPGVRAKGETGDRREWYGASDNHRIVTVAGAFDATDVGVLAPVSPPPTFGFSSSPKTPSVTRVRTTVQVLEPPDADGAPRVGEGPR